MTKSLTGAGAALCAAIVALAFLVLPLPAIAAGKYALIIANQHYRYGGALDNPIKDAKQLGRTLRAAGFKVDIEQDLGLDDMRRKISSFGLAHENTDDVALLYYSGHGAEFGGKNYLIPVDARFEDIRAARAEALTLDDVQNFLNRDVTPEMKKAGRFSRGLNIIVLDACRNNPYPARTKSIPTGLGKADGAAGTLIWYATQPGEKAKDGVGKPMSPFAQSFSDAIAFSRGEPVEETFKSISLRTLKATGGEQRPWQAGFVTGTFRFKPGSGGPTGRILAAFDPSVVIAPVAPPRKRAIPPARPLPKKMPSAAADYRQKMKRLYRGWRFGSAYPRANTLDHHYAEYACNDVAVGVGYALANLEAYAPPTLVVKYGDKIARTEQADPREMRAFLKKVYRGLKGFDAGQNCQFAKLLIGISSVSKEITASTRTTRRSMRSSPICRA